MPTGTRLMCYTSRPSVLFIYILYPLERSPIETTEQPAPSPLRGGGSTKTKKGLGGGLSVGEAEFDVPPQGRGGFAPRGGGEGEDIDFAREGV